MSDNNTVQLVQFERIAADAVVDMLCAWLIRAQKGELTGIAIAGVCYDGSVTTQFSQCPNTATLQGALARLQYRMTQASFE